MSLPPPSPRFETTEHMHRCWRCRGYWACGDWACGPSEAGPRVKNLLCKKCKEEGRGSKENTKLKDFGKGWMSLNARDLCKIAFFFGGVAPKELVLELHRIHPGNIIINTTTVEKAFSNMNKEASK